MYSPIEFPKQTKTFVWILQLLVKYTIFLGFLIFVHHFRTFDLIWRFNFYEKRECTIRQLHADSQYRAAIRLILAKFSSIGLPEHFGWRSIVRRENGNHLEQLWTSNPVHETRETLNILYIVTVTSFVVNATDRRDFLLEGTRSCFLCTMHVWFIPLWIFFPLFFSLSCALRCINTQLDTHWWNSINQLALASWLRTITSDRIQ